jgi:hypothetical protein
LKGRMERLQLLRRLLASRDACPGAMRTWPHIPRPAQCRPKQRRPFLRHDPTQSVGVFPFSYRRERVLSDLKPVPNRAAMDSRPGARRDPTLSACLWSAANERLARRDWCPMAPATIHLTSLEMGTLNAEGQANS